MAGIDAATLGMVLGILFLAVLGMRVYRDAVHRSQLARIAWTVFACCLPPLGFPAFLAYRYGRVTRSTPATVR